jgi:hypothetical protein
MAPFPIKKFLSEQLSFWPEELHSLVEAHGAEKTNRLGEEALGYPAIMCTKGYEFRAVLDRAAKELVCDNHSS